MVHTNCHHRDKTPFRGKQGKKTTEGPNMQTLPTMVCEESLSAYNRSVS